MERRERTPGFGVLFAHCCFFEAKEKRDIMAKKSTPAPVQALKGESTDGEHKDWIEVAESKKTSKLRRKGPFTPVAPGKYKPPTRP